jgi:hypothetical protein
VPILLCIALSFFSQFNQAKHALPAQAQFDYPMVPAIAALKDCSTRYVAAGDHLLKPDTNAVYGISDFRFHNPIFPAQFTETMLATGAKLDGFNQNFNPPLSPKLGLASVSRILSLQPIWSQGLVSRLPMHTPSNPCDWQGLRLNSLSYAYDRHNKQIVGKFDWQANVDALPQRQPVSRRLRQWHLGTLNCDWSYSIVLADRNNATLWFSDGEPVPVQPHFQREFAIPLSTVSNGAVTVCLQLFNTKTASFVQPLHAALGSPSRLVPLFTLTPQELNSTLPAIRDTTFSLVKEVSPTLRLYENTAALPSAYIVQQTQTAHSPEQALAMIGAKDFDFSHSAVTECDRPLLVARAEPSPFIRARVARPSAVEVVVGTNSDQPGLLVLTDTFYPGWKADIDGKAAKIVRTNGMFRGVFVPGGNHTVRFIFVPLWFYAGLSLAVLCSVVLLFGELLTRFRQISTGRKAS